MKFITSVPTVFDWVKDMDGLDPINVSALRQVHSVMVHENLGRDVSTEWNTRIPHDHCARANGMIDREVHVIETSGDFTEETRSLIACGSLARFGVFPCRMAPMCSSVMKIPNDCKFLHACYSGSWLYGLGTRDSDYDISLIVGSHHVENVYEPQRTKEMIGEPYVRSYVMSAAFSALHRGSRFILELIYAPDDCLICPACVDRRNEHIPMLRKFARRLSPDTYLSWHSRYFDNWMPHLRGVPCHEPDESARRWKYAHGWAYKIGYYLLIDAILMMWASKNKAFNARESIEESGRRDFLIRLRNGAVPYDEWLEVFREHTTRDVVERLSA